MENKCPNCGGKYGLIGHWQYGEPWSFGKRFCSLNCKAEDALKKSKKPPDPQYELPLPDNPKKRYDVC